VLTSEETTILLAPVSEDEVNIRPDGLIYMPHIFVRERLNRSVGIGQWALIENRVTENNNTYMFDGSLYIRGHFISRAIGEMQFHDNNSKMSPATCYEGAKSDSLVRNCKDLGIGKECWQPRWSQNWVMKFGVKVWRDKQGREKKGEFQWRHIDSMPFYDETSVAADSPNKPAITLQSLKDKTGIKSPDKKPAPEPQTAQKGMNDEALEKKIASMTSLNDMRILYNEIVHTDPEQYKRFTALFSDKKKELQNKMITAPEGKKPATKDSTKKEPVKPTEEKPKPDVLRMVIEALKTETFERDHNSCEALISDVKDDIKRHWYYDFYMKRLKAIGLDKHVPKIKNIIK
jgi:hypothetical protein